MTVTHRYAGRVHRVPGARVSVGTTHALTGPDGTARVTVRRAKPGSVRVTATKQQLVTAHASVAVRAH